MSPLFAPAIAVHAIAGILGLALAIALMLRPAWLHRRAVEILWIGIMSVVVTFLIAAVVVGWPRMDLPRRLMDAGLIALAAYTLLRAVRAVLVARGAHPGWGPRALRHVGFGAISLFDGFVIVSSLRAGMPVWAVVLVGVAGVVTGVVAQNVLVRRWSVAGL